MAKEILLEVKNLSTHFYTKRGILKAIDGIDFDICCGENLGIIGESGCGKSVTALSIMRLIQGPSGKIVNGEVYFQEVDLLKLTLEEMRKIRGNKISMIFQEPMTSLNPVFTVGDQISEAIIVHKKIGKNEARNRTIEMLKKVGIPLPEQRVNEYPHQLSGGMRQRVMIAMALSCNPYLLIADEPTTALDVTIQAQILDILLELKNKLNMSMIIITHDMGVISEIADKVAVMYAGEVVEYSDVKTLFMNYKHPYTYGLINCLPKIGQKVDKLMTIPGNVPSYFNLPRGCKFSNRCTIADSKCFARKPELVEIEKGHKVRCWHYDKVKALKEQFKSI